jgi:hypothetical protein
MLNGSQVLSLVKILRGQVWTAKFCYLRIRIQVQGKIEWEMQHFRKKYTSFNSGKDARKLASEWCVDIE